MLSGLVPVAVALWLATVSMFDKETGQTPSTRHMSEFSTRPCGSHQGTMMEVDDMVGQVNYRINPIMGPTTQSQSIWMQGIPGASNVFMNRFHQDHMIQGEGVEIMGDALSTSEYVYNDVPLLGLRSYDFQFSRISFYIGTWVDDFICQMRYGNFSVFSLSEDRLQPSRSMTIAPGLYDMINHAYSEVIRCLPLESIILMTYTFNQFLPLEGFTFVRIQENSSIIFRNFV